MLASGVILFVLRTIENGEFRVLIKYYLLWQKISLTPSLSVINAMDTASSILMLKTWFTEFSADQSAFVTEVIP